MQGSSEVRALNEYPCGPFTLCDEDEAACMIDYCNDCRANPEIQMPPYEEYREDWLESKLMSEVEDVDHEAAEANAVEEQLRRSPAPLPFGDDGFPF